MTRFKVPPQVGTFIQVFDGNKPAVYRVKNGEIEVPDDHAGHILAGVAGAELIKPPETPAAKSVKLEAPVKE